MFKDFTVNVPSFTDREFIISDFGAVTGGKVSSTEAIKKAILEASKGGGRVIVPDGIWLTGPIELLSNVELHLSDNAVILFDKSEDEYPLIVTDYEGIARIRTLSQIYANNATNIAITGNGIINGNGHLWRPIKEFKMTKRQWAKLLEKSEYVISTSGNEGGVWVPTKSIFEARFAGEIFPKSYETDEDALLAAAPYYDFYRPVMVNFKHCTNVLIEGVRLQNSPAWSVHPYFCEHLTIRNVMINNPYHAQNGDGIDVDSCRYVHIHHCDFQTGDDGICLKSGKDRAARALVKPCEDVYIHDCKVGQSHGGFVIGSEMSRGVKNVLVKNCTFIDSDVGIRFKSAMGRGGVVEDIYIEDILMSNIQGESVVMTMDYVHNLMDYHDPVVKSDDPEDIPEFKNVYYTRIICSDENAYYSIKPLDGYPNSIHDINFKDCEIGDKRDDK